MSPWSPLTTSRLPSTFIPARPRSHAPISTCHCRIWKARLFIVHRVRLPRRVCLSAKHLVNGPWAGNHSRLVCVLCGGELLHLLQRLPTLDRHLGACINTLDADTLTPVFCYPLRSSLVPLSIDITSSLDSSILPRAGFAGSRRARARHALQIPRGPSHSYIDLLCHRELGGMAVLSEFMNTASRPYYASA